MRPFQIVLIGFFVLLALGGVLFMATFEGGPFRDVNEYGSEVVIWGTLDGKGMQQVLDHVVDIDKNFNVVTYIEKDPATFDSELLNAIAEGRSPDLVIFTHEMLFSYRAKLLSLTYETFSERRFRDTYVDGADIFMRPDGVYGLPFAVDPMVLYWNRDLFSSAGLAAPPKTWEELLSVTVPTLRTWTNSRDIERSGLAFGEYVNVSHAKNILSMLFLQSGTNIVEETNGGYTITLGQAAINGLPPAAAALSFYTQFAVPTTPQYTWNRSKPLDRLEFLRGNLGMYFAPGSELSSLRIENPNLNFDMAAVPQGAGATTLRNYGDIYAFAFLRSAPNPQGAYLAALKLSDPSLSDFYIENYQFAPVHRAKIQAGTTDSYDSIRYQAALVTRGWLDPNPAATEVIFKQVIEDITSGRGRVNSAISDAGGRLQLLFK